MQNFQIEGDMLLCEDNQVKVEKVLVLGRNIIFGKEFKKRYQELIFSIIDSIANNEDYDDTDHYKAYPLAEKYLLDPSIADKMSEDERYCLKMHAAIGLSQIIEDNDGKEAKEDGREDCFDRYIPVIQDNRVTVQFDLDGIDENSFADLYDFLTGCQDRGIDVDLVCYRGLMEGIDGRLAYVYNEQEREKLEALNSLSQRLFNREIKYQIAPAGVPIKQWTHSEVMQANKKIDKLASDILALNPTPLEAMIMVYKYVTSFHYKEKIFKCEDARTVLSVLSGQKDKRFVCVGFSQLQKAVIDKMALEGLECKLHFCLDIKTLGNTIIPVDEIVHCNNLISIRDKFYDVEGKYLNDSTKDSPDDDMPFQSGLANMLLPIEDADRFNKMLVRGFDCPTMQEAVNTVLPRDAYIKDMKPTKLAIITQSIKNMLNRFKTPVAAASVENQGKPIPVRTIRDAYYNALRKMRPHKEESAAANVADIDIAMSIFMGRSWFRKNAVNEFAREGYELSQKEYKQLGEYVFAGIVGKDLKKRFKFDEEGNLCF